MLLCWIWTLVSVAAQCVHGAKLFLLLKKCGAYENNYQLDATVNVSFTLEIKFQEYFLLIIHTLYHLQCVMSSSSLAIASLHEY